MPTANLQVCCRAPILAACRYTGPLDEGCTPVLLVADVPAAVLSYMEVEAESQEGEAKLDTGLWAGVRCWCARLLR